MKIGEVATASGCHLETVRYYERIGLLPKPRRTGSGYRSYTDDDVRRLRFITRGRELGFSLEEIRSLLRLSDEPDLSCAEVDQIARHHLTEIEQRVVELKRMAKELKQTITTCRGEERAACAILDALHAPLPKTTRHRRAPAVH
jgi:MerR family transcriptional regulator, mercuric resistance operon regulatory protein